MIRQESGAFEFLLHTRPRVPCVSRREFELQ